VLQDYPPDPLYGFFKIRPNERRNPGPVRRPVEREAPSSVRDGLKVGGREILEPVGQRGNTGICTKSYPIQVLREQTLATLTARQADLNLLRKPTAPKHPGVDMVRMVCGANQEHVLFSVQITDLNHELLGDLDVVMRREPNGLRSG